MAPVALATKSDQAGKQVTKYTADTTPAALESYILDFNANMLTMTFTDVVKPATFAAEIFTIQNAATAGDGKSVTLTTASTCVTANGYTAEVALAPASVLKMKKIPGLASNVDKSDSFVTFGAGMMKDLAGDNVLAITDGAGKKAASYVPDTTNPSLSSFTFNMGTHTLTLKFTEAVNKADFKVGQITIKNSDGSKERELSGEPSVTASEDETELVFVLEPADEIYLRAEDGLADDAGTTYITLKADTVKDYVGLKMVAATATAFESEVNTYTEDEVPPFLVDFGLDMDADELALTFSEVVRSANSDVGFGEITIQAAKVGGDSVQAKTLSGGSVKSVVGVVVTISLLPDDINAIKALTSLATSASTTYVSLTAAAFKDKAKGVGVSITPIASSDAKICKTGLYNPDGTVPTASAFSINMATGVLVIMFSETIDASQYYGAKLKLQSTSNLDNGGTSVTLTNSAINPNTNSKFITVKIDNGELNKIKADTGLALAAGSAFLTIDAGAFRDTTNLHVTAKAAAAALGQATAVNGNLAYQKDNVPPELDTFTLNVNAGTLTLNFKETVKASSIFPKGISIQKISNAPGAGQTPYQLTGDKISSRQSTDSDVIVVALNDVDINALKLVSDMATKVDGTDTFISMKDSAFTDMANPANKVKPIAATFGVQAAALTQDISAPSLSSFTLNMDTGASLVLNFDEVVDAGEATVGKLHLQSGADSSANGVTTFDFTAESSSASSVDGKQITITIGPADLNRLKGDGAIARGESTTFLRMEPGFIVDLAPTPKAVTEITTAGAKPIEVGGYGIDETDPALFSFKLNMKTKRLEMTFTESVDLSATNKFDLTKILLQSQKGSAPAHKRPLSADCLVAETAPGITVTVSLADADVNFITKNTNLAVSAATTFLSIESTAFRDMEGRALTAITKATAKEVAVGGFVADDLPPKLDSFDLHMNDLELTVTMKETVKVSSLNPAKLFLIGSASGSVKVQLLNSALKSGSTDGTVFVVTINPTDANALKAASGIATKADGSDTFLTFDAGMITDMANIPCDELTTGEQATTFNEDESPPILSYVRLNMHTGTLSLEFSETVNAEGLNPLKVAVRAGREGTDVQRKLILASTAAGQGLVTIVDIALCDTDLDFLKLEETMATGKTNTYVTLELDAIFDTATTPRGIRAIPVSAAVAASDHQNKPGFVPDTKKPTLSEFDFNMNANPAELLLTFSEPVKASTLEPADLTLQNADASETRVFKGFASKGSNGRELTVTLSATDIKELKLDKNVGVSTATSSLALAAGAVSDMNSQDIAPVTKAVSTYSGDITAPTLLKYTLNMKTKVLSLEFSEPMLASSLAVGSLTLYEAKNANSQHEKLSDSTKGSTDGNILTVTFSDTDVNAITTKDLLAIDKTSTNLAILAGAVTDMAGIALAEIGITSAKTAHEHTPDTRPPKVTHTKLNMHEKTLEITFDETVKPANIDPLKVKFHESALKASTVPLSAKSTVTSNNPTSKVVLNLHDDDLNKIKLVSNMATTTTDCYLNIEAGAMTDMANTGNDAKAGFATVFVPDTAPPVFLSAAIDMHAGTVEVEFDEPVRSAANDIDYGKVEIFNGNQKISLNGGSYGGADATKIKFLISSGTDLDEIKLNTAVATSASDSNVRLLAGAFTDMSAAKTKNQNAEKTAAHTPDEKSPSLLTYQFNLDDGSVTMNFDEPMKIESTKLKVENLFAQGKKIANANVDAGEIIALTSSTTDSVNGKQLVLKIDPTVLNNIKKDTTIFKDLASTYVSLAAAFLVDMNDRSITEIAAGSGQIASGLNAFVADESACEIQAWSLNMNLGILKITFDETIDTSSTTVEGVSLQKGSGTSAQVTLDKEKSAYVGSADSHILEIKIHADDLNKMKLKGVGLTHSTAFLVMDAGAVVKDMSGRGNKAYTSGQTAKGGLSAVGDTPSWIADTTAPTLTDFKINMNSAITLHFNEPVDINELKLSGDAITIQELANGGQSVPLTTASSGSGASGQIITVLLGEADAKLIKVKSKLARSQTTSYVKIAAEAIKDLSGVAVNPDAGKISSAYDKDAEAPILSKFVVDLRATPTLILEFDEPVDGSTLDAGQITIRTQNGLSSKLLSSGTASDQGLALTVTMPLAPADANVIKSLTSLAIDTGSTWLEAKTGMVKDREGVLAAAVANNAPKNAAELKADATNPTLSSFVLDMNAGKIFLTFSEAVKLVSCTPSQFTLQTKANKNTANTVTLKLAIATTKAVDDATRPDEVTFGLTDEDLNAIKVQAGFGTATATQSSDVFITFPSGAIADYKSLPVDLIADTAAKPAASVTADSTVPTLKSFHLNLEAKELKLTFSEAVDASSLKPDKITIQDAQTASSGKSKGELKGTKSLVDGSVLTLDLDSDDVNAINLIAAMSTEKANTYLTFSAGMVADMANLDILAKSDGSAAGNEAATEFSADETEPELDEWHLNLEAQTFTLKFSEAIDIDTLVEAKIILHSDASSNDGQGVEVKDFDCTRVSSDGVTVVTKFTDANTESIKQADLCSSTANCYMVVQTTLVKDLAKPAENANPIKATLATKLKQATSFTVDSTKPVLVKFKSFSMDNGEIKMSFSESVKAVNPKKLTLHSYFDESDSAAEKYKLNSDEDYVIAGVGTAEITIKMSTDDLNEVKKKSRLCRGESSCFVRYDEDFVTDIKGNKVIAVTSTSNFGAEEKKAKCDSVAADVTGPVLKEFSIDIDTGAFKLTFDEPVKYSEFVPKNNIVLQSTKTGGSAYTITTARDTSVNSYVSTVMGLVLSVTDRLKIKANAALGLGTTSTFVSINDKVVEDVSGKANKVVAAGSATAATGYSADKTAPKFSKFIAYNNNNGDFTLEFDDAMDTTSNVDFEKITFSNNAGKTHTLQHAGTVGYVDATLKTQVKYEMHSKDMNAIRLLTGLLTDSGKCFVIVEAGHMKDFVTKASVAPDPNNAVAIESTGYTTDTTNPKLLNFVLDVDKGMLHLTFDDVVLKSSLKASEITLSSKTDDDSVSFPLTGGAGTTSPSAGAFEIAVELLPDDLNAIKLNAGLGTCGSLVTSSCDSSNTFIYFGPLMITDASSTPVEAIGKTSAKSAASVTQDNTDPKLTSFELNMNDQKLTFNFDEAIVKSSFKLGEMKIQSTVDANGGAAIPFEEAALSDVEWNKLQTTVTAKMTKTSFNAIAAVTTLASEMSSTYLVMSAAAAQDTASRQITEIVASAAKITSKHSPDITPPTLTHFTLNMDTNKVTLTFSETVKVAGLVFGKLTIQPTNAATPSKSLGTGTHDSTAPSTTASFVLAVDDVKALKLSTGLATVDLDSAISAGAGLVLDMNNQASAVVTSGSPVPATSPMTKDGTDIELDRYTFNLHTGILSLKFKEPALLANIKVGEIKLQNAVGTSATEIKPLVGGEFGSKPVSGSTNGNDIEIQLSDDDLNAIKTFENLGTTKAKTIIVLSPNAATDMVGNKLVEIDAANGVPSHLNTPDTNTPTLSGFAVNMHDGTVTLNFNEPIRANSLKANKITVQSNKASVPAATFKLTGGDIKPDGDTSSANGLQIIVKLKKTDLDAIKKDTNLLTATGDSFVSLESGAVADMAGNLNAILAMADAKKCSDDAYVADEHAPTIESFTLNMNSRRLVVGFSETMALSSFKFTKFKLQTSSDSKPAHQHTLSAGTKISTDDGTSFEVELTEADANQLKVRLIGSEEAKTWLTAELGAVQDKVAKNSVAVVNGANALKVTGGQLVPDSGSPELDSFDLDMDKGLLTLSFNEAIDDSKIVATSLKLVASTSDGAAFYDITSSSRVCTKCANNAWIKTACSQDADTECESCKTCSSTEYYTAACTDSADAACAPCSDCNANQYIAGACTGFSNTECATCTSSCPANTYRTAVCTADADIQCATCTVCADDEYVKTACTGTSNTVCEKHSTSCPNEKYMTVTGTKTADITCASCKTCGGSEFEIVACGVRDRVCKECSTPEDGFEYLKTPCGATTNAVVDACAVCGAGKYASTACSGSTNAVCTSCTSDCNDGKFASAKCTAVADTTCSSCPAYCKVCGTSGACVECDAGYGLADDYTCGSLLTSGATSQNCPDRFFKAADGHCDHCNHAGKTCTGPALADIANKPNGEKDCIGNYASAGGVCTHICDVKGYYDEATGCTNCHSDCKTCWGGTEKQCRTCPAGKKQFGYECGDVCPDGWYETNGRCRRCSANCKTCSDGTTCTECQNGKILDNSFCHDVCPDPMKFGS